MSRNGPIAWRPQRDKEILAAVERQSDLYVRWRQSQADAMAASEAIAKARADDEAKRPDILAAGGDDPGALDVTELERAAEDAATRRDVLGAASAKARAVALALADERSEAWTAASEAIRRPIVSAGRLGRRELSAASARGGFQPILYRGVETIVSRAHFPGSAAIRERSSAEPRGIVALATCRRDLCGRRDSSMPAPALFPARGNAARLVRAPALCLWKAPG